MRCIPSRRIAPLCGRNRSWWRSSTPTRPIRNQPSNGSLRIAAGAGSDSHVPQGLGAVKIRMRDFEGPEEFLESLREADIILKRKSLLYVQALKFIQTRGSASKAKRRSNK